MPNGFSNADLRRLLAPMLGLAHKKLTQGKEKDGKKAAAKSLTVERNTVQLEIEAALTKIATAASLIYEKRPEIAALFESTLPKSRSRSRKKKTAPAPGTEPAPE